MRTIVNSTEIAGNWPELLVTHLCRHCTILEIKTVFDMNY